MLFRRSNKNPQCFASSPLFHTGTCSAAARWRGWRTWLPTARATTTLRSARRPSFGKGRVGSALMGATATFSLFDRGTFWGTPLVYLLLSSQKCQGVPFFPNLSKSITFAAAPSVSTPFVRNQPSFRPHRACNQLHACCFRCRHGR